MNKSAHVSPAPLSGAVFHNSELASAPLTDYFERKLTYLRLSVTDFCNFRCNYCLPYGYQGRRPDNELTLTEIKTLFLGFAKLGTTKVRLTGGEPSIRADLSEIIRLAKQTDGIQKACISSNGYKLGKHLSVWQQAGLDKLNLSIDSFNPQIFHKITGHNSLPQLLRDIDKLLETTDISLKINSILMADTAYDNLLAALDFVKNRPIAYRFIEFMQTSDNSELFFAQHASSQHIKSYLHKHGWRATVRPSDGGPAIEYSHSDYLGKIGLIEPYSPQFCDSCNRLRVSSLGKVHLCLFDNQNYNIRPYLSIGDTEGLMHALSSLMPIKPEHHHLNTANNGLMHNLSMVGG